MYALDCVRGSVAQVQGRGGRAHRRRRSGVFGATSRARPLPHLHGVGVGALVGLHARSAQMTSAGPAARPAGTTGLERLEAWFVTGSQHLYGEAVLERVGEHAREIAAHLDGAADVPVRIVWRPVVTTPEEIARRPPRGRCRARLRRRRRLDAYLLAGQDVDRRPDRPAQAPRPPAHAVQPRPAVGRDRHGVHEPPSIRARRPGVRVHPDAPPPWPQDRRRALAGSGGRTAPGGVVSGSGRLARGPSPADRPLRRQHA